jgi:hypothetical protein
MTIAAVGRRVLSVEMLTGRTALTATASRFTVN